MKSRFLIILCAALLFMQCSATAGAASASGGNKPVVEEKDCLTAAKRICLLFQGNGDWENADMETVGCCLLASPQREGDIYHILLLTVHSVFDTSSGTPKRLAGSRVPVIMALRELRTGTYQLVDYLPMEDGADIGTWIRDTYDSDMPAFWDKERKEALYKAAEQDAVNTAQAYIESLNGKECPGVWNVFLQSGSDPDAKRIVRGSIDGNYPYFEGIRIWAAKNRTYELSVEGEQSYSGILTFSSYDENGEPLSHVTLQVQNHQLVILEGELPAIVYE